MPNTQEYGLFQLLDLAILNPNQLASTVDSGLLISSIEYDRAQHNADIDALLRLFTVTTSDYQLEVAQSGSSRSQPVDENGRTIPVKPPPPYTVAFPLQGSGTSWGSNFITRVNMSARDLARTLAQMYRGDYIWVEDHVLGHLFQNASYVHRDPTGKGDLTIRGPANGDAVTYFNQYTQALATDSHFLFQAAGIADGTNPYPTIAAELKEHPSNGGEVIAFISTSLKATTQALTEFRSANLDSDIQLASTVTRLVGSLNVTLPAGATVLGKTDSGVWIVEWPRMPAGYIIAIMTNGPRPLARRQFDNAVLQGFKPMGTRDEFPYFQEEWQRWEGYGGYSRIGAVVMQVGAGSYSVPTNLAVPMR